MRVQVLVVGAGPVGMTAASELRRYGVSVRIVDRAPERTDKSKALVLWSRTLELLDRAGSPVDGAAPFVAAGFKANAVNFVAADGDIAGRIALDSVKSPYPYGLMIPQSDTERLLDERLGKLGITVERRIELVRFVERPDLVEAILRHPDGHEETVQADWLLGCDGAHSAVRHGLGASFAGETMDSDWMLADVHMRGYPFPDSEASVYWHRDGVFVIFPISPGRYRVIADLPGTGQEHPAAPTLEEAQAIMTRRGPPGLVAFDPIWLAGFRINGRKVADYRHGRAFLLGDAAHVHSPAGGQGMNTGMQDAFNLAWKLAMVVRGKAREGLLESFSAERSKVGDEVLKSAGRLTVIGTLKNPVAQAVRDTVAHALMGLTAVRHKLADTMTEVTIGYPGSPLNGPASGASPKPGERWRPTVGHRPPGGGETPLFSLFADRNDAALRLTRRFAAILDPDIQTPPEGGCIWLVRPDGYVACSTSEADEVARYLEGIAVGG